MTTLHLVNELHNGNLDLAILAAPVEDDTLKAFKLFDEPFYLYTSDPVNKGKEIKPADLEPSRLWLLEEGHCMRSQILNFCELKQQGGNTGNMVYSAGSIESLVNLVDIYGGYTIIPALAKKYMSDDKQGYIYPFTNPQPVREISLVGLQSFPRKKVIQALHHLIIEQLPDDLDKLTDKIKVPHNVFKNTL